MCLAPILTQSSRTAFRLFLLFFGILSSSAQAQTFEFFSLRGSEGQKIEYTNPAGYSCRQQLEESPALIIGAGLPQAQQVIPGITAGNDGQTIVIPSKPLQPTPTFGAAVRIPFRFKPSARCDRLIEIDEAFIKLEKAKELFDNGLISKPQLEAIAAKAYAVLNR